MFAITVVNTVLTVVLPNSLLLCPLVITLTAMTELSDCFDVNSRFLCS